MSSTAEVVRVKEAYAWVEGESSIQLKAVTAGGDPVTLSVDEARRLAERLTKLSATLESLQAQQKPK